MTGIPSLSRLQAEEQLLLESDSRPDHVLEGDYLVRWSPKQNAFVFSIIKTVVPQPMLVHYLLEQKTNGQYHIRGHELPSSVNSIEAAISFLHQTSEYTSQIQLRRRIAMHVPTSHVRHQEEAAHDAPPFRPRQNQNHAHANSSHANSHEQQDAHSGESTAQTRSTKAANAPPSVPARRSSTAHTNPDSNNHSAKVASTENVRSAAVAAVPRKHLQQSAHQQNAQQRVYLEPVPCTQPSNQRKPTLALDDVYHDPDAIRGPQRLNFEGRWGEMPSNAAVPPVPQRRSTLAASPASHQPHNIHYHNHQKGNYRMRKFSAGNNVSGAVKAPGPSEAMEAHACRSTAERRTRPSRVLVLGMDSVDIDTEGDMEGSTESSTKERPNGLQPTTLQHFDTSDVATEVIPLVTTTSCSSSSSTSAHGSNSSTMVPHRDGNASSTSHPRVPEHSSLEARGDMTAASSQNTALAQQHVTVGDLLHHDYVQDDSKDNENSFDVLDNAMWKYSQRNPIAGPGDDGASTLTRQIAVQSSRHRLKRILCIVCAVTVLCAGVGALVAVLVV